MALDHGGNSTPISLLVDLVQAHGETLGKLDQVIAEQGRAAERRDDISEAIAEVRHAIVRFEAVPKALDDLAARVRDLERERDQASGVLRVLIAAVGILGGVLGGVIGSLVTALMTRMFK